MRRYLDTSFLLPLFSEDAFSPRAHRYAARLLEQPLVSDFAVAEFTAVIAKRCRMGLLSPSEAEAVGASLDRWHALMAEASCLAPADVTQVIAWLRRHDINLRAPDALHLAIAARLGVPVVTFDAGMATAARQLSIRVEIP